MSTHDEDLATSRRKLGEYLAKMVDDRAELLEALETLTTVWREAFPYIDQSPSFQNALAAIRKAKGQ